MLSGLKQVDDLVCLLRTSLCQPEDVLIEKGEESYSLFFINSGQIEIFINNPKNGKIEGEYFLAEGG